MHYENGNNGQKEEGMTNLSTTYLGLH
jgi:hypothetical protein